MEKLELLIAALCKYDAEITLYMDKSCYGGCVRLRGNVLFTVYAKSFEGTVNDICGTFLKWRTENDPILKLDRLMKQDYNCCPTEPDTYCAAEPEKF